MPSGGREGGGIAPGVVVESEKVASLVISAAVHVVGGLDTVFIDIGCGVANRYLAVFAIANVLLHITSDGLNVRSGLCCWDAVDDLIAGEEKQGVAVLGEFINGGKDTLEILLVV